LFFGTFTCKHLAFDNLSMFTISCILVKNLVVKFNFELHVRLFTIQLADSLLFIGHVSDLCGLAFESCRHVELRIAHHYRTTLRLKCCVRSWSWHRSYFVAVISESSFTRLEWNSSKVEGNFLLFRIHFLYRIVVTRRLITCSIPILYLWFKVSNEPFSCISFGSVHIRMF
jgi:hypothetical protein